MKKGWREGLQEKGQEMKISSITLKYLLSAFEVGKKAK